MSQHDWAAERFEADRARLQAVAYRILGSLSEADDAVQEAWFRLSRADPGSVENLSGWLTTVVARICLDMLRARAARREEPISAHVPDAIVSRDDQIDPEHAALVADSVGLALLVVLETLGPAERLAFVLHDIFAMPFDEIAPIVERSPAAARKLASRARQRVRGAAQPDTNRARQREIVNAFLAASRDGDFAALLTLLDPDVVLRLDRGAAPAGASRVVRGAQAVVDQGFSFSGSGWQPLLALVNGTPGIIVTRGGRPFAVIGFTLRGGRIAAIDMLADPARVRRIDLAGLSD